MTRLPDGMRDKIKKAADASGRSMNAEIVHRLEQSFSSEAEAETLVLNKADFGEYIKQAFIELSKTNKSIKITQDTKDKPTKKHPGKKSA